MKTLLAFGMTGLMWCAVMSGCNSASDNGNNGDNVAPTEKWEFNDTAGWVYFHQDTATIEQWAITDDGCLALTTRGGTYDRTKMHTADRTFAAGTYSWRTYVPAITPCEQVSVGSWIYHDDHHELDFEVGPGKAEIRRQYNAAPGQLLACMTNQDFPFHSGYTPIDPGWHDFALRLDVKADGMYAATWMIDGEEKQQLDLQFGPEIGFTIQCSIENLKFIGDTISASDYTALFDYVSFHGRRAIESPSAK